MFSSRARVRGVMCVVGGVLTVGMIAAPGLGQVLPKVPPAPEPTPEYVPPPPPPPAPTKPPEPEVQLRLVERDADGGLKMIEGSVEAAAIKAYPFDAERSARIAASIAAREAEIERFVIDHLPEIGAANRSRAGIESVTDFGALNTAREAAKPLRQDSLLDRLQREGIIGGPQRSKIDQAIAEYTEARTKAHSDKTGADVMKIATIVGKQAFNDITRDAFDALDRLGQRALGSLRAGDHGLTLTAEQQGALKGVLDAGSGSTNALRTFLLDSLSTEQAKALLGRFVPPAPAK